MVSAMEKHVSPSEKWASDQKGRVQELKGDMEQMKESVAEILKELKEIKKKSSSNSKKDVSVKNGAVSILLMEKALSQQHKHILAGDTHQESDYWAGKIGEGISPLECMSLRQETILESDLQLEIDLKNSDLQVETNLRSQAVQKNRVENGKNHELEWRDLVDKGADQGKEKSETRTVKDGNLSFNASGFEEPGFGQNAPFNSLY